MRNGLSVFRGRASPSPLIPDAPPAVFAVTPLRNMRPPPWPLLARWGRREFAAGLFHLQVACSHSWRPRSAVQIGVKRLTLPAGEFGPQDADLIGGVESEPHPAPSDLDHGQGDAVADDDLLAGLPAQNQHGAPP